MRDHPTPKEARKMPLCPKPRIIRCREREKKRDLNIICPVLSWEVNVRQTLPKTLLLWMRKGKIESSSEEKEVSTPKGIDKSEPSYIPFYIMEQEKGQFPFQV